MIIRPMTSKDLDPLIQLIGHSGHGLTSLPKNPDVLSKRLKASEQSFQKKGKSDANEFLFALEGDGDGELIGVSGIYSSIGIYGPNPVYEIRERKMASAELNTTSLIKTLHFKSLKKGFSEICSLYLHPQRRKAELGRFLSLSRFLFMADHLRSFEPFVMAQMRGVVDEAGENHFWSAVGAKFFKMDFSKADHLAMNSRQWIEDLHPPDPIYLDLLPLEARTVIGQTHPKTTAAAKILKREGFSETDFVGIFESGPILLSEIDNIRTIQDSITAKVLECLDVIEGEENEAPRILSNRRYTDFRSCLASVKRTDKGVFISKETAHLLQVNRGEKIRLSFLNAVERG
ncbi:MAG: arginine N-succinyltransferase [Bacteriovoracales bacterium]|nr:arginine N-succinyltransferase [Bacteriovoracales bacterium]